MTEERFCLKWNDFQENLCNSIKEVREAEHFTDITLASEDNQLIEAHKFILFSSSSFFKDMLRKNKHSHPFIFMKGVKGKYLTSVINFMYYGEVNIFQEDLNKFLDLAFDLQIRGLSDVSSLQNSTVGNGIRYDSSNMNIVSNDLTITPKAKLELIDGSMDHQEPNSLDTEEYGDITTDYNYEETLMTDDGKTVIFKASLEELDKKIENLMVKQDSGWACTLCEKVCTKTTNIKSHIEAKHIIGMQHPCPTCSKVYRTRNSLRAHNFINHSYQTQ